MLGMGEKIAQGVVIGLGALLLWAHDPEFLKKATAIGLVWWFLHSTVRQAVRAELSKFWPERRPGMTSGPPATKAAKPPISEL
jgi:hypothetical protein